MNPHEIIDACDLEKLPAGPRILSQLVSVLRQPEVPLSDVAELFRADAALSTRVVTVCNSPFYGLETHTTDIREAVLHLGIREVSRVAHVASITDFRKHPTHLYTSTADHYWERSLHTACIIDEISGQDPAAYTAAIMHLVGIWVLCSIFPVGYLSIEERELELQAQLEQHRLGVNFARAGSKAMSLWGFDPAVCGAVLWQLAPSAAEDPRHRELAELLNRAVAITDWHCGIRNEHTLIRSDLTIDDIESCNQRALERVSRIAFGS